MFAKFQNKIAHLSKGQKKLTASMMMPHHTTTESADQDMKIPPVMHTLLFCSQPPSKFTYAALGSISSTRLYSSSSSSSICFR